MTNIAQIGVGYWGPNLLRNLMANPNCRVKAVIDLSEERRNYVTNLYHSVLTSDDIDVVINDPSIDAIVIATPAHSHFDISIKALKQGKHVLVEKPMATSDASHYSSPPCAGKRIRRSMRANAVVKSTKRQVEDTLQKLAALKKYEVKMAKCRLPHSTPTHTENTHRPLKLNPKCAS